MAIFQISKIQNRKGLQVDLPLLSGGELGWSVDERRLWIGNGNLQEGAPVLGNTEILTEFSDIFGRAAKYTYRGDAAGYAVETGPKLYEPVRRNLQAWMEQWVSVKDFGAIGDGQTDDTAAINRAMFQLYCHGNNPATRRALYFPAGHYLISDTINIPPYAKLYGEGPESSMIVLADWSSATMVAQTVDSLFQEDEDMGNSGAVMPTEITIQDIGLISLDMSADIIRINSADGMHIENVALIGAGDQTNLTSDAFVKSAAIRFINTGGSVGAGPTPCSPGAQPGVQPRNIRVISCSLYGTTWGVTTLHPTTGYECAADKIVIDDCSFDTHYRGVLLGGGFPIIGCGPRGVRITNCTFDEIYAEGIIFGNCLHNASGHNIFYDVGNHFGGGLNPQTFVIDIQSNDNISVGDLFMRGDQYSAYPIVPGTSVPKVHIGSTRSIAWDGADKIQQGTYTRRTGLETILFDNVSTPGAVLNPPINPGFGPPITVATMLGVDLSEVQSFRVDYSMVRNNVFRRGEFTVSALGGALNVIWDDEFTENASIGVWLYAVQVGTLLYVTYESDNRGIDTTFRYSMTYL